MEKYYWILEEVKKEVNRENGLEYYRATYTDGINYADEFFEMQEFIPSILSKYHFD